MNYLAHLLLAGNRDGDRLGALLGDHIKGRAALQTLPAPVLRGVELHRFIDSTTDRHPANQAVLASLQPPFRRYGGVIVDVLFDHFLDRHWPQLSATPLDRFVRDVQSLFARHEAAMPLRLRRFMGWADGVDLWTRYGERDMLNEIFRLLAARHGRPSPLARGVELLDTHGAQIERAFLEIFPDVLTQAEAFRNRADQSDG